MILIAIVLLLVTMFMMVVLRLLRRPIFWHWITALLGGLGGWGLVLLARHNIPHTLSLLTWQLPYGFSEALTLSVDNISWPYSVAIAVLPPVIVLTALARHSALYWRSWAGTILMTAIGLVAVCAGDAFTLLLAWASLDLLEMLVLFAQGRQVNLARNVALIFGGRALALGLVLLAILAAKTGKMTLDFDAISTASAPYLLLAAVLRLGVLPLNAPIYFEEIAIRRGLGTALRLISAASGLILLTRTAVTGIPQGAWFLPEFPLQVSLLVLVSISALIGSVAWATAKDEISGQLVWMLASGSMAAAAAISNLPEASLAWGMACLFSGGMIFLHSARGRGLWLFPLLTALAFSGLPLTPGWNTAVLYQVSAVWLPFFWVVHGLLLFGTMRHAFRPGEGFDQSQRWVGFLYVIGLILLLGSQFFVGYLLPRPDFGIAWWSGPVAMLFAVGVGAFAQFFMRRGWHFPQERMASLQQVFSLSWLYRWIEVLYRLITRLMTLISQLLEGDGGLLWVFILVGLLVTLYLNQGGIFEP